MRASTSGIATSAFTLGCQGRFSTRRSASSPRTCGMPRAYPRAVERENRPARRERALDDRVAEQAVQPAQRPAERQPLVDVAEDHDPLMDRGVPEQFQKLPDLVATLGRPEAQVRDDDAHLVAGDLEVDVERVARLPAGPGEGQAAYRQHLAPREQRVAIVPVGAQEGEAGHGLHAGLPGEQVELVVRLLQADGVAAGLLDYRGYARRVLAAVGAGAAGHVVRRDEPAIGAERLRPRRPVSEAS